MPTHADRVAPDALTDRLYGDLRALARAHLRRERDGHTLSATALLHEAWLRLAGRRGLTAADRRDWFAVAAATMRRVLVDHARQRRRLKRGGGALAVSLDDVPGELVARDDAELLALDEALDRLGAIDARARDVVVHRFFGGRSLEETAEVLGVSVKTVQRDWLAARAWLRKELGELEADR
jgi:RNA polymerase sigma-70 factor, ECF subfamily